MFNVGLTKLPTRRVTSSALTVPFIKNDFSPLQCNSVIFRVLKKVLETYTREQTPRMSPYDNFKYFKKIPEEKFEIIKNPHF